jgi:anti-sigma factor RsiW
MSTTPASDDFREQLSAWHDGALPDEPARFVSRRLLQDEALRAEVGRWQAIGDVLRRERQQVPASDVAQRVAQALAAPRRRPALRWIATAAAVGMAAVLMWPSSEQAVSPSSSSLIASTPPAVAPPLVVAPRRDTPAPLVAVAVREPDPLIARVPPLVRAPQPTPEQLAPLPAVDAPGRPWPRSASGDAAYTVDYAMPVGTSQRQ